MPDIFLSYSRKDKEFAQKLVKSLADDGRDVWIDWEDIPVTADWLEEIYQGIRESNAFVFVISPDSVQSEVCGWELKYALENKKRLIPILRREIIEDADKKAMHPTVSSHNWIFFRDQDDYDAMYKLLDEALKTDLEHTRMHTRVLIRAREWENKERKPSFLFDGDELVEAETWLVHASDKDPEPTELQYLYIYESRKAVNRRQQLIVGASLFAAVVSLVLAIAAIIFYLNAEEQRQIADEQRQIAETNAEEASSLALAANAQLALGLNDNDLAIALGQEAVNIDNPPAQSITILQDAVYSPGTRAVFSGQHDGSINAVEFNPTGDNVASGGDGGKVVLWNLNGGVLNLFEGHEDTVNDLTFNTDGTLILSGAADGIAILWDVETGEEIQRFFDDTGEGHDGAINAVAFSPNDNRVVTGGVDGFVVFWDIDSGAPNTKTTTHSDEVTGIAFNADGSLLASSSLDRSIVVQDVESGEVVAQVETPDIITGVVFNPDGETLLSSSGAFTMNTWTIDTENATLNRDRIFSGHLEWVDKAVYDHEGLFILSASDDDTVRLWNSLTGNEVNRFGGHSDNVKDIAFSPDGRTAITGSADGTMRLLDLANGLEGQRLDGHSFDVILTEFVNDGEQALTTAWDNTIILWDLSNGTPIETFLANRFINASDLSADGTRLAIGDDPASGDPAAYIIDVATKEVLTTFSEHGTLVSWITFNPDESMVASAAYDDTAFIWDAETGEILQTLDAPGTYHMAFNADGTQLLTSGGEEAILWDVATGEEIKRFTVGDETIEQAVFSPDGTGVLLKLRASMVLMDIETSTARVAYEGHSGTIRSFTYSADGTRLLTGSQDGTLRLWDAQSGEQLQSINYGVEIRSVALSPDGTVAMTGAVDWSVRLWNIVPPTLAETREWAEGNRYTAEFTCDQRDQFNLEQTEACIAEDIEVAPIEPVEDSPEAEATEEG
ncbi:MAG: TIR domain-containing protein [Aggregatilineales bacterium]